MAEWKESEHPRDDAGKFTDKAGGASYRSEVNERIRWARENNVELPLNNDGSLNDVKLQKIYSEDKKKSAKKFVPAKSVQEAEQYARENIGADNVVYKGIDIEIANEINASIQRGLDVCPQIKDRLKSIGNAQRINNAFREEYARAVEQHYREFYPLLSDEEYKRLGKQKANKDIKKIQAGTVAFARRGSHSIPELNAVVKKYEGIMANELL